jgi:hypothetical protein
LEDPGYENWQFGTGFIIGVIAAGLCLMCTITIGVCKQIFFRIRTRLESKPFLREVLPPVIGGFCIGKFLQRVCLVMTATTDCQSLSYC